MNAELKAKWVAKLRSGEYEQHKGRLRSKSGKRHCCLGVLCDITARYSTSWQWWNGGDTVPNLSEHGVFMRDAIHLADMNDKGKKFPEISDYIEANL